MAVEFRPLPGAEGWEYVILDNRHVAYAIHAGQESLAFIELVSESEMHDIMLALQERGIVLDSPPIPAPPTLQDWESAEEDDGDESDE